MYPRRSLLAPARLLLASLIVLILIGSAFATTERMVYGFTGQPDGVNPNAGLVADAAGNLYGTTSFGGTNSPCNCGTVFELSPPATAGGAWTENILYSFQGGNSDGIRPMGTLTFDAHGNLYGTTLNRGSNNPGTIFKLSPPATAGGAWTENVLFIFPGTVFKLKAPASAGGAWTLAVLHDFNYPATAHGSNPNGALTMVNGVFYGTTIFGGPNEFTSAGTVSSVVP